MPDVIVRTELAHLILQAALLGVTTNPPLMDEETEAQREEVEKLRPQKPGFCSLPAQDPALQHTCWAAPLPACGLLSLS